MKSHRFNQKFTERPPLFGGPRSAGHLGQALRVDADGMEVGKPHHHVATIGNAVDDPSDLLIDTSVVRIAALYLVAGAQFAAVLRLLHLIRHGITFF